MGLSKKEGSSKRVGRVWYLIGDDERKGKRDTHTDSGAAGLLDFNQKLSTVNNCRTLSSCGLLAPGLMEHRVRPLRPVPLISGSKLTTRTTYICIRI